MNTEAAANPAEDEGIGANKRRKKPPTKVKAASLTSAKDAVVKTLGPANDSKGMSGTDAAKTFQLDYTDNRGFHWSGEFTIHVLTIGERTRVGLTRSQMAGGISLEGIDETTLSLMEMQAHLALAIDKAPAWADDLSQIRDIGVLTSIYSEVASHEATFWGTDS